MKLKFEYDGDFDLYSVSEPGYGIKSSHELLGWISKFDNLLDFHISEEYSGIIMFEELEQIYKFMKKLKN